ncbi:hypothetical protein GOODEAATRI_006593 [Goodea atripinnis]|uniref:Sodium-coupled monocarboxylate transporter 1 n=1 Tax=Goodea atripinnis TaxID=208336 RepID=A0ABV0NSA6_9TELE
MSGSPVAGCFAIADYVVFALILLISAAIGVYYAWTDRSQRSSRDFLTGGRKLTALPVSMSLTASFMSAITVLANPAEVYRYGASIGFYAVSYVFTMLITSEVFLPVFYKLSITSTYEYLELRFNRATRLLGTMLFIVQTGGLKAVVWTDVIQLGVMLAGFLTVIIRSVVLKGGVITIISDSQHGGRLNLTDINALAAVTVEDIIRPNTNFSEKHLSWMSKGMSFFYGVLCIGMTGLASLMGGILQGALSGLVSGLVLSLWVGIGAQIYPPPHDMSRPLPLSTDGCNLTMAHGFNWTSIALPTQNSTAVTPVHDDGK